MKSNLCDYNDAYILVKDDITLTAAPEELFRNCATFIKCIMKINQTKKDYAEDLDLVLPMYNLTEYSSNYSRTTGSLWFYPNDEGTNFNANISYDNSFKFFKHKANTEAQPNPNNANGILKNAATAAPLTYLSNFWRSFEMQLINCKVELTLKLTKYCVLSAAGNDNNANNIISTIKHTKLYVPVVTLSTRDNQKLSKRLSKGL